MVNRVFVLDPSLDGEMSHHYYAATAYRAELEPLGLPWKFVCHSAAPPAVTALPAQPIFQAGAYYSGGQQTRAAEFQATALCNAVFFDQLCQMKALPFAPGDFVFFPVITSNLILGTMQWIATFEAEESPTFGMCLMTQMDWHTSGRVSEVGRTFYEQAFACLDEEQRARIQFTCETEALADEYTALCGTRPSVMPIPTLQHLASEASRSTSPEAPTLTFMGYAKPEKGFDRLPEIIRNLQSQRPELRFVVQLMGHDEALIGSVRRALTELGDGIEMIEGAIAPNRMVEVMSRTDLMLLPYDAATYRSRGSAIFTECKLIGVPMLVPRGSAVGEEAVRKGFGHAFEAWEASAIADAALVALDEITNLEHAAAEEAKASRHSGYLVPLMHAAQQRRATGSARASRAKTPRSPRIEGAPAASVPA